MRVYVFFYGAIFKIDCFWLTVYPIIIIVWFVCFVLCVCVLFLPKSRKINYAHLKELLLAHQVPDRHCNLDNIFQIISISSAIFVISIEAQFTNRSPTTGVAINVKYCQQSHGVFEQVQPPSY